MWRPFSVFSFNMEKKLENIIEARNIWKVFGGVRALKGAEFICPAGRIVGLLGENGSGKTTLSRILTGYFNPTEGEVLYRGRPVKFANPHEAAAEGIAMIHQNFSLVPELTVRENMYLGNEPVKIGGFIDQQKIAADANRYLGRLCPGVDPESRVSRLTPAQQQLVEIAKTLSRNPGFLILDEPTSALEREQVENLFALMNELKRDGVSMVFISHRMHEVEEICDHIIVLRNGETAGTVDVGESKSVDYDRVVNLITGQARVQRSRRLPADRFEDGMMLEAEGIEVSGQLRDINMVVRTGEIVGVAGLQGQGQEELIMTLAGFTRFDSGRIWVNGEEVKLRSPSRAIEKGIALVPGNRQTEGLFMDLPIQTNLTFPLNMRKKSRWFLSGKQRDTASDLVRDFSVKTESLSNYVSALSGGNAQKVVVAKWLPLKPGLLLLSDPAKGIDIQAKADLYGIVTELAAAGTSIIVYASDLNELIGICDRILVMYEGNIVENLQNSGLSEEFLMSKCIQHGGCSDE